MEDWDRNVEVLIQKSFIIEKTLNKKEDQNPNKSNKSHKINKRKKVYQIDKSLSRLILESMNEEEVADYDYKIMQLIVNSSKHKWYNYFDVNEFLEIYEDTIRAVIKRQPLNGKYGFNHSEFKNADAINLNISKNNLSSMTKFKDLTLQRMRSTVNKKTNIDLEHMAQKIHKRQQNKIKKLNNIYKSCFSSFMPINETDGESAGGGSINDQPWHRQAIYVPIMKSDEHNKDFTLSEKSAQTTKNEDEGLIYTPKAFKEASYVAKHGSLGFSNLIKLDDDFLDVHPEQTFKHYSDVDSDDQDSDSFSEEPPIQTLFTMMDSEAKKLSDSKFGINDQESSSFSSGTDMESEKQLSS